MVFSTDEAALLTLTEPVLYDTWVLDANGAAVDADLAFQPSNPIAERPLALTHRARSSRAARVPLPPGNYAIRIAPLDPDIPSVDVTDFVVTPGRDLRLKELFLPDDFRRLRGPVRSRVSTSDVIIGVEVTATGLQSGLMSTTDTSDDDGEYELLLPESSDTAFRVRASLPDRLQPSWEYEQIIRVPDGENREKSIDLDIPSDALRGTVQIEVLGVETRDVRPVADARVTLTASVTTDIEGRVYTVSGRTDADGRLIVAGTTDIPMLRGSYEVLMTPPSDSPFARIVDTTLTLDAIGNGVSQNVQLVTGRRPRVRGRILDGDRLPIPFAEVILSASDGTLREFDALADEDGVFELTADPGRYVMVVSPRTTTSLFARRAVTIEVPEQQSDVRLEPTILGSPEPVRAFVRTPDGLPVPHVEITLFGELAGLRYVLTRATSGPDGQLLFALYPLP
ncbi:MAG: carboxypeptidase-like regulatory domain-containing protein [Myxococcota bacterium]